MRNDRYDPSLLHELDRLDLPGVPLDEAEEKKVLALARGRANAKRPRAVPLLRRVGRWGRNAAVAAAACAVLLGGVNLASPALAESLPVVGNLFAWINRDADARLRSEQLNQYAGTVEQTAESAEGAYTVTLGQIYRDEDWLRLSLLLTAADGSLDGFDTIRADADGSMPADTRDASGTLVLGDGSAIMQEGQGWFTRQPDGSFVMGLNYPLFLDEWTPEELTGQTVTLGLHGLVACNTEIVAQTTHEWGGGLTRMEYHDETPLEGDYTLTFTMPAPSTEGVRSYTGPQEQNGVTLHSLTATPAAAKLDIQVPADGSIQLKLTTEDGTLLKQERGEGVYVDENDPASDVRWTHYFDTVPEDCRTVTVTVYDVTDYDAPDGYEILAEFTVPLD